jgi:hypothetical protein
LELLAFGTHHDDDAAMQQVEWKDLPEPAQA